MLKSVRLMFICFFMFIIWDKDYIYKRINYFRNLVVNEIYHLRLDLLDCNLSELVNNII